MFAIAALPSLLGPLISQFAPTSVAGWLNLALGIIVQGKNVKDRLAALDAEIRGFAERGEEPDEAWWARYRGQSDVAHGDIQDAARETGG